MIEMNPSDSPRPLAIVTGASAGIGRQLAELCATHGYDLLVAADEPAIHGAAGELRDHGVRVDALQVDLATLDGVDQLCARIEGRPVEALLANAGHGLGGAFLDQDIAQVRHVIDTNVTGTVYLIQQVGRGMRARGRGKILITGSIAGFIPGTFHAVYNGTKAFVDSFSFALRAELKDSGVTVTCLMPGATDTDFFARADMERTKVGQSSKDDPAFVAKTGFEAMLRGDGDVVSGWRNKLQTSLASVTPAGVLAEQHRAMAEPLPPHGSNGNPGELQGWWLAGAGLVAGVTLGRALVARRRATGRRPAAAGRGVIVTGTRGGAASSSGVLRSDSSVRRR